MPARLVSDTAASSGAPSSKDGSRLRGQPVSPPPARPRLGGRRNDGISLDRKVPSREQGRPTVANQTRGGRRDCGGDSPAGPPRVALDVRPLPPQRRARRGGRRGFWSSKPPGGEHGPSHRRVPTRFVQKYTVRGSAGRVVDLDLDAEQAARETSPGAARGTWSPAQRESRARSPTSSSTTRALYRCAPRAAAVGGAQGKGASLGCVRRSPRSRCARPAARSTGLSMEWGFGGIF